MAKKRTSKNKTAKQSIKYSDEDKIKKRAYFIWEAKGRKQNTTLEDWLEAEEELREEGII